MEKRLAIIGASSGQKALIEKAKEMGIKTFGFAWEKGAACKDLFDKYFPLSILEIDKIAEICKSENIQGVVSNGSELTALISAQVAEKVGLLTTPSNIILKIQNKKWVREATKHIDGLSSPRIYNLSNVEFPCIIKPQKGDGKKGVSYCASFKDLHDSIVYSKTINENFLIEEFIQGREISVETLSYKGEHYIIQFTDKLSYGPPHFIEIGHRQPSTISASIKIRITNLVYEILKTIHFSNGACHIELKIDDKESKIYLIEINCRGGGDKISDTLIKLSTGYDYLKGLINISLNVFMAPKFLEPRKAGVYFLSQETETYKSFFINSSYQPWVFEKEVDSYDLRSVTTNYNRNGYLVYFWNHLIRPFININPFESIFILNKIHDSKNSGFEFFKRIKQEESLEIPNSWLNKIYENAKILVHGYPEIDGWCVIYCNNYKTKEAYCAGLNVLTEKRGQGIGKKLIKAAIELCITYRFKKLILYCNNPVALKLYLNCGFIEIDKKKRPQYNNNVYSKLEIKL